MDCKDEQLRLKRVLNHYFRTVLHGADYNEGVGRGAGSRALLAEDSDDSEHIDRYFYTFSRAQNGSGSGSTSPMSSSMPSSCPLSFHCPASVCPLSIHFLPIVC